MDVTRPEQIDLRLGGVQPVAGLVQTRQRVLGNLGVPKPHCLGRVVEIARTQCLAGDGLMAVPIELIDQVEPLADRVSLVPEMGVVVVALLKGFAVEPATHCLCGVVQGALLVAGELEPIGTVNVAMPTVVFALPHNRPECRADAGQLQFVATQIRCDGAQPRDVERGVGGTPDRVAIAREAVAQAAHHV
jgi:hypothetical protein